MTAPKPPSRWFDQFINGGLQENRACNAMSDLGYPRSAAECGAKYWASEASECTQGWVWTKHGPRKKLCWCCTSKAYEGSGYSAYVYHPHTDQRSVCQKLKEQ